MRHTLIRLAWAVAALFVSMGSDWLQFRGTDNTSVSGEEGLPTAFTDGKNVAWKVSLPGRGPSSPIVVDGRVVVTCSSGFRQDRLHVLAVDSASGDILWHRQIWATGHTLCNPFSAVACNTPASDGQRIFVFYSSNDLACFDLEGNLQWLRGLAHEHPTMRNDSGMGSSPLVIGPTVVVQMENQGESFVAGIDAQTGATRWRLDRRHDAVWCSPTVLRGVRPEEDILLLQTRGLLSGHDPRSGGELWRYEADCHTIASVTTCGRRIYLPANGLHALEYDPASRSVRPLWYQRRLRGNNSSPVASGGRIFRVKSPGILVCGDAASGQVLWQLRLKGPVWATPLLAGDRLYVVSHGGLVQVVACGEKGQLVGTSQIDGGILASPAVAGGAIYFRSDGHLWKVSSQSGRK